MISLFIFREANRPNRTKITDIKIDNIITSKNLLIICQLVNGFTHVTTKILVRYIYSLGLDPG